MGVTRRKRKARTGRKAIFFQAEVYVGGERVASQSFDNEASAWSWHDGKKKQFERGKGYVSSWKFRDLLNDFEKVEMSQRVSTTKNNLRNVIKTFRTLPIMETSLDDFDGRAIFAFLDSLKASKLIENPNRHSFQTELKILRRVLNYYRERHDELFVVPIVKPHWDAAKYKAVSPRRKDFFIRTEDIGPWLEKLAKRPDPVYEKVALFQLIEGTRIGETCALKWPLVDLQRDSVRIERTMDWRDSEGKLTRSAADRTKTPESNRVLPIPPVIKAMLQELYERRGTSDFVFVNRFGRPLGYNVVRDNYKKAFEAIGLSWSGTHICRFTNATLGSLSGHDKALEISLGLTNNRQLAHYSKAKYVMNNVIPINVARQVEGSKDHVKNHVNSETSEKSSM